MVRSPQRGFSQHAFVFSGIRHKPVESITGISKKNTFISNEYETSENLAISKRKV